MAARRGRAIDRQVVLGDSPGIDTTLLTLFLFLLFAIPARLVVGPIGSAGTPANLLGVLLLLLWARRRLQDGLGGSRVLPLHVACGFFAASVLASYASAMTRDVSADEIRGADRGLILLCAWLGVALFTADSIRSRAHLQLLLNRVVILAAFMASLGIAQFLTGIDISKYIVIPGLHSNVNYSAVLARNGYNRPAGTASHPIEFGVVLATVLPLALYLLFRSPATERFRRGMLAVTIALGAVVSVSRSAILGFVVAGVIVIPTWPKRRRRNFYLSLPPFLLLVHAASPGLLGTLGGLFTNVASDSSTTSRTGDYSAAATYISQRPQLGRGFGTFIPDVYRVFDNQYLLSLVEVGVIGTVAVLAVLLVGPVMSGRIRGRSVNDRSLATALMASACVPVLTFATFDALSFPVIASLVFFLAGLTGALTRLAKFGTAPGSTALDFQPLPNTGAVPRQDRGSQLADHDRL